MKGQEVEGSELDMKTFNTTGRCIPEKHYMVDIHNKLVKIKQMVQQGSYFVINRARQYGKTTTLRMLPNVLSPEYAVISLDFQKVSSAQFADEEVFSCSFAELMLKTIKNKNNPVEGLSEQQVKLLENAVNEQKIKNLGQLFYYISDLCAASEKPIVLVIDEVDSAANNQVFLDFLTQLRAYYLDRDITSTFYSVILAGVYDIKNLKLKIRPETEHGYNSPWNIAVEFRVDMSFNRNEIQTMLNEYEVDWKTGMDTETMADLLYDYTAGYPYLVSKICQILDEQVVELEQYQSRTAVWTKEGFLEAVKRLLKESNTLFDDILKKLQEYAELKNMLWNILFQGENYPFNPYEFSTNLGLMFGFVKERENQVVVANRIFETLLYNLFLAESSNKYEIYGEATKELSQFVSGGVLQMDVVMRKFMEHFTEIYADASDKFIEENGRRIFLIYLRPIINGTGNYYIEAQTRDRKRTDIIVDYKGVQEIIELKIWHGEEYQKRGEKQLFEYLDFYHKEKGYLLSFNFNKKKKADMHEIEYGGKRIVEVVV